MEKELESIIENEFDCLIDDLGCLMNEEWKAESIKKAVAQAFALGVVSQQRELLTSFAEYLKERDILTTNKENIPVRVDLFLKRG